MILLPVTLCTAGAAAVINFWLGLRISRLRLAEKIFVGDGGDDRLVRRMRAQLNFAEYVPLILVLLALVELAAGTSIWLWGVGAALIVGRICHAFGMDGWGLGRRIGIALTMLTMLGLAAYGIYISQTAQAAPTTVFKIGPKN
ncbi:MAPEG family protein [Sphingomonas sp. R-74633]|uniref:MAPEG family protein n=1 Tax=Sphingomonas sp. R-74633 TaxID=2751188 RepID=UPI0015D29252|nr:MAPEG family protein [Sphingomonas sp. R-74633]NYT41675.1 MAPEG family protein [Sphingomonas sp. R-74633]